MELETQFVLAKRFHALHHAPEMLVLPNAWDAGSAVIFEKAGFNAVGTTSAGIAYTLGYPDGQQISLSEVIYVVQNILRRIHIPLSVDIEAGYGTNPAEVVETVRSVINAGAVGINLEDGLSTTESVLIPLEEQCLRIRALATLKTEMRIPFFINARTDVYWLAVAEDENRLAMTVERCEAYRQAGADGVFVPGLATLATIRELLHAIDTPLNVLPLPSNPMISELKEIGVARLSLGSGPVRAVLGLAQKMASELYEQGSIASMVSFATPYDEMNRLFE